MAKYERFAPMGWIVGKEKKKVPANSPRGDVHWKVRSMPFRSLLLSLSLLLLSCLLLSLLLLSFASALLSSASALPCFLLCLSISPFPLHFTPPLPLFLQVLPVFQAWSATAPLPWRAEGSSSLHSPCPTRSHSKSPRARKMADSGLPRSATVTLSAPGTRSERSRRLSWCHHHRPSTHRPWRRSTDRCRSLFHPLQDTFGRHLPSIHQAEAQNLSQARRIGSKSMSVQQQREVQHHHPPSSRNHRPHSLNRRTKRTYSPPQNHAQP